MEKNERVAASTKGASTISSASISAKFVDELSEQGRGFCIIGLTGRVRSGTADVCRLLTDPKFLSYMNLPSNISGLTPAENREYRVIYRYLRENWKPFAEISVTSVIISYFLDLDPKLIPQEVLSDKPKRSKKQKPSIDATICRIYEALGAALKSRDEFKQDVMNRIKATEMALNYAKPLKKSSKGGGKGTNTSQPPNSKAVIAGRKLIASLSGPDGFFTQWKEIKETFQAPTPQTFAFCFGVLPALEARIKDKLKTEDDKYPRTFQDLGNNIRATGSILGFASTVKGRKKSGGFQAQNLFSLPQRVNEFVKVLRRYRHSGSSKRQTASSPVFVVINNFKNIFEAYYFKRRYSAFYLLSVACDERLRQEKFDKRENFTITNLREDLSRGKKLYNAVIRAKIFKESSSMASKKSEEYKEKLKTELAISNAEIEFISEIFIPKNTLRKEAYAQNIAPFILQDVVTCIENADIFVTRNYKEEGYDTDYIYDHQLIHSLARIITLILHPGLLSPTKLERCMQIAMTAKLNSGCLSRQVGAVVTDSEYNILSLGWNDAPCGTESCLRRNLFDLARNDDPDAYSRFEQENQDFRNYITDINKILGPIKTELRGLPMAFCFKDIYQDLIQQRDQIYTRALHGEERALASCGNERACGGYLFTTSSPCELCAKRAREAGIKKIYYIQQYPGISRTHVVEVGANEAQAEYESFVGAVGLAYVKLYTPLIPYKDELAALNFSPAGAHDRWLKENKPKSS